MKGGAVVSRVSDEVLVPVWAARTGRAASGGAGDGAAGDGAGDGAVAPARQEEDADPRGRMPPPTPRAPQRYCVGGAGTGVGGVGAFGSGLQGRREESVLSVPPGPRPLTMGPSCPHTDVLAPPPPPRPLSLQAGCRRRVPSPERTSCQLRPSPNKTLEWGSSSVAHESHRGCRASSVGVSPGPGRRFLSPVGPEHLAEGGAGGCGGAWGGRHCEDRWWVWVLRGARPGEGGGGRRQTWP